MITQPIASGKVEALCLSGKPADSITFTLEGPAGDQHSGFSRRLSGHDGAYIKASDLEKGAEVFNWRTWTGLSRAEVDEAQSILGREIPQGCLLENIVLSGIPNFSKLAPTSRLVFPKRDGNQAILAVWEENGPCKTVGERFVAHTGDPALRAPFLVSLKNKRGVMGFVLSPGLVLLGDTVHAFPPAR